MTEKSQSPLLLPTPQDEKIPSSRRAPMPTQGATSTTADTLSPQRPTTHPEEKLTDGDVSRINSRIGSLPNQTYIDRGCQQKERKEALVNLSTPRKGYTILYYTAPKCKMLNGVGNPEQHLALFKATCGNTGGNEALLLLFYTK